VSQGLSLKSSRDEFMSNIIRFFGVEAVWKQSVLPPHLPNICQSDGCKAVFCQWRVEAKSKKKFHLATYLMNKPQILRLTHKNKPHQTRLEQ
jgi:hypothetical protein